MNFSWHYSHSANKYIILSQAYSMQRRCRRRDEVNTAQNVLSTVRRPQIKSEDHAQLKPIQRNDGNGPVLGDAKYTSNQPPHALVMQRHDARERAREHRPPRTQLQRPAKEPTPHTHARTSTFSPIQTTIYLGIRRSERTAPHLSAQIPSVPSSAPPTSRRSPVLRFSTDSMAITPDGRPKSDAVELGVPGPAAPAPAVPAAPAVGAPDGAGAASLAPRARARSEERATCPSAIIQCSAYTEHPLTPRTCTRTRKLTVAQHDELELERQHRRDPPFPSPSPSSFPSRSRICCTRGNGARMALVQRARPRVLARRVMRGIMHPPAPMLDVGGHDVPPLRERHGVARGEGRRPNRLRSGVTICDVRCARCVVCERGGVQ